MGSSTKFGRASFLPKKFPVLQTKKRIEKWETTIARNLKNARNRAESIKKSHFPHDCEYFLLYLQEIKLIPL